MGQFVMVVQSRAHPGREREYDAWYDTTHFGEMLAIPGVKSGRRFDATALQLGGQGLPCLAIFDIEADDPRTVMAELGRRKAEGAISVCEALDAEATTIWFYKAHEPVHP
jgi:hypothetical protein